MIEAAPLSGRMRQGDAKLFAQACEKTQARGLLDWMESKGYDAETKVFGRECAASVAAQNNDDLLIEMLARDEKSVMRALDEDGTSPLQWAASKIPARVAMALMGAGMDPWLQSSRRASSVEIFANNAMPEALEFALGMPCHQGPRQRLAIVQSSLVPWASRISIRGQDMQHRLECGKLLSAQGVDWACEGAGGWTPAMHAACRSAWWVFEEFPEAAKGLAKPVSGTFMQSESLDWLSLIEQGARPKGLAVVERAWMLLGNSNVSESPRSPRRGL